MSTKYSVANTDRYIVSVVMAAYNVERYIADAIDSLIEQSDNWFEHTQLIIVDDGSVDTTLSICNSYAERYPDNVIVLHQPHQGSSAARNLGLQHIRGRYVSFMDSDDRLSANAFAQIIPFFDSHSSETDLVSFPMYFFGARSEAHHLNYKFDLGTRIISLRDEWDCPQLSLSSAFVKREALVERSFDTRLSYAEDAKLIQEILLEKQTMGVVSTASYLYRRRGFGNASVIESSAINANRYLPYLLYFQNAIVESCLCRYNSIPLFVQNTLLSDLQWRLLEQAPSPSTLSLEEWQLYKQLIFRLLSQFDDRVIMAQHNLDIYHRLFILQIKDSINGTNFIKQSKDEAVCYTTKSGVSIHPGMIPLTLSFASLSDNQLILEGFYTWNNLLDEKIQIIAMANEIEIPCDQAAPLSPIKCLDIEIATHYGFKAIVNLFNFSSGCDIEFSIVLGDSRVSCKTLHFGSFFPLSTAFQSSYYQMDIWMLTADATTLHVRPSSQVLHIKSEFRFLKDLWLCNQTGTRKAIAARIIYHAIKAIKKHPLWVVSDRASKAGDNGEAFFSYLQQKHDIRSVFVLTKSSKDRRRLSDIGTVLVKDSFIHKIAVLLSDYIISSHAETEVYNPFYGYDDSYKDILARKRFVFLQHGITKDNVSEWLCRYNKNIYGLVTATTREYESFMTPAYGYPPDHVWLTGFPRYDRLYRDDCRIVTVMPTWRRYLLSSWDRETDSWSLSPSFMGSAYRAFYTRLLNDQTLLKTARQCGYTIAFCPHPTLQDHIDAFSISPEIKLWGDNPTYTQIFAQSKLVLTDYSSAVFDFAYLRKPIVYTHFDRDEFFSGKHVYKEGYFDYETDGFGEVCYTYDKTVEILCSYIKNDCRLKNLYRDRIDAFFKFGDKNNCERLYNRLICSK